MKKGVVISIYCKTAVILVRIMQLNRFYKKIVSHTSKIKADVNNLDLNLGDVVIIDSSRPKSAHKSWVVVKKIGTEIVNIKRYDNS